MTKKILGIGLLLVAISVITFHSFLGKNDLSGLMLENIEALASGEWGPEAYCIGSGSVDCPRNQDKVRYVISGYSLENIY